MFQIMDTGRLRDAMNKAVIDTFGDMTFIDVLTIPELPDQNEQELVYYIDLLKPVSAKIILYLPPSLRQRISENVYNNSGSQDVQGEDCILEILNILAGSFLSYYFGHNLEYKIEFPGLYVGKENVGASALFEQAYLAEDLPFHVSFFSERYRY